jgi:hypothetical protein
MSDKQIHTIFNEQGQLVEVAAEDIDTVLGVPPVLKRVREYDIGWQLNYLYDDVKAGLFGEAAKTGQFVQFLESIKDKYPKT